MMTEIMKKHLKKKKGFTLIEVVVVLVILAILAAIAIPALVGYIDDANERAAITEARTALVGLQHMASTQKTDKVEYITTGGALSPEGQDQIDDLTGEDISGMISNIELDGDKVIAFTFTKGDKVVNYADGTFTLAP